jgi:hypothetical protein
MREPWTPVINSPGYGDGLASAMVVGALAQNRLPILDTKSAAIDTHGLIRKSGGRGSKNRGQGESYCGIFVSIVSFYWELFRLQCRYFALAPTKVT